MSGFTPSRDLAARLHRRAAAGRWGVTVEEFAVALETSARSALKAKNVGTDEVESYWAALNLEDLALATACASGHEQAWEHFVREYRPALYRAADAIDPTGGARELADSIHGELFGLRERGGVRQSLFKYFHGRSALGTWLRAMLAQRHVDRLRAQSRIAPLPDPDREVVVSASVSSGLESPDTARLARLVRAVLTRTIAALPAPDRLRLSCYYRSNLTLAEIGRLFNEHEATASRHLARIRRSIRHDVERRLREDERLDARTIEECFAAVLEDAGALDLAVMLGENRQEGAP